MADSRLNDWNIHPDPVTLDYHLKQQDVPYRSTVHFARFCDDKLKSSKLVVDAGCGAGGPTAYLAKTYPHCVFSGFDESENLIVQARAQETPDLTFHVANFLDLPYLGFVDGVVLLQVLSWIEDYCVPLSQITHKLKPHWIAFSTLCYDGNIDCQITVNEIFRPRWSFYNIYSLPRMNVWMKETCGYDLVKAEPFVIDIDLEKPANPDLMGTYTLQLQSGGRLQCSGPLHLPWYFVMYERAEKSDDDTD
jgi:SAM-dependent methyltransferase